MLYILLGEDDFSRSQALEEIKRSLGDRATLATNTTVLDGAQVTLDRLRSACETVPFLAERRLVIIEGLLERFEPKNKASPKKRSPDPKDEHKKDEPKTLAEYFARIPDFTTLVLVSGKIGSRNPLLSELSGKAEVKSFPMLRDTRQEAKLSQWSERRVKEAGGSISPGAIDLLTKFVGGNLWVMANEIDKLVLFTAGRCIDEKDVKAIVSDAQEANVFTMVDAILGFRADAAGQ